jgi:hypothetical protein
LRSASKILHTNEQLSAQLEEQLRESQRLRTATESEHRQDAGPSSAQRIAGLEAARIRLIGDIEHLQSTRSWRMTAPLRIIERVLRTADARSFVRMILRDAKILWTSIGSPLPETVRFIRHRMLGRLSPVAQVMVPADGPTAKLTVMIRCTNRLDALQRTVESIARQTVFPQTVWLAGPHDEPDAAAAVILRAHSFVQWIGRADEGWMLRALLRVPADHHVLLLEEGTVLHPTYVAGGMEVLGLSPDAGIAYTDWHDTSMRRTVRTPSVFDFALHDMGLLHPSCIIRREALLYPVQRGDVSWESICAAVREQGWQAVKSRSILFVTNDSAEKDRAPQKATLCLSLSGRDWMWNETCAFLERQTYPHELLHLAILDTSQDPDFGRMVRTWLQGCDYAGYTYLQETVGQQGLADLPRRSTNQLMSDACAFLYNRFARICTTPLALFLEDDIIPPDDAYVRLSRALIEHDAVTASATYRHRLSPRIVAWRWSDDDMPVDIPVPGNGVEEVGGTGFGCMAMDGNLLRSTVFNSGGPFYNYDMNFFLHCTRQSQKRCVIDWNCRVKHFVREHHYVTAL